MSCPMDRELQDYRTYTMQVNVRVVNMYIYIYIIECSTLQHITEETQKKEKKRLNPTTPKLHPLHPPTANQTRSSAQNTL